MEIELTIAHMYSEGKSPYEISEELTAKGVPGYYPVKVRRLLKKMGIAIRDKSSAQTSAISTGRSPHPTRGKTLSETTKSRISAGVAEKYSRESDEEKERRSSISRDNWAKLTPEQLADRREKATKAILLAAKNGSKVEQHLYNTLTQAGYAVVMHANPLPYQPKLQCDLYIKDVHNGVVIEVDGLSHVEPIWGEKSFQQTVKADIEKNVGITTSGLYMVRLHAYGHKISKHYLSVLSKKILSVLSDIKEKPLQPLSERLIHVKVD